MSEPIERVEAILDAVRDEYAPDPRTAVFEVWVERTDSRLTLEGAVSEPAAVEELHRRIGPLELGLAVEDRVRRLPHLEGGASAHALVTSAIAPLLAGPTISETHLSQAVLGTRLLVLREHRRWLQVRAEDGYLGWVHQGYLQRVEETEARAWEIGAEGEVGHSLGASVLDGAGEVLARAPWGARLLLTRGGEARLPDGRTGRLDGEWVPGTERAARFPARGEAVVATAGRWIGAPYLWGGTTPAGVDCSGLMQAVFRLHGVQLPRDSDQQARVGEEVDPGPDFDRLRPGDLLFFAEEPGRVTHVTMSTGGSRIIHSSLGNGGVARNDMAGELPYERELRRIFVCARRILEE